jgi:biotin transport system substrate-specific component
MRAVRVRNLVLAALFAALTAVGAFIKIPMPIAAVTLQTMFCVLAGMLLGPWLGALSQAVYVVIGLIGVPVFTNGGGLGYIFEPSFGYLLGLSAGAIVSGLLVGRLKRRFFSVLLASFAGLLAVYVIGVPYLYVIKNVYQGVGMPAGNVLYYGLILFIPGDILKGIVAALLAFKLRPILMETGRI